MSMETIAVNNNPPNCITDIVGNETSYADPLVVKNDDDEPSIMSLHRECKDDGMYDTSAAAISMVATTTSFSTPLENHPQKEDHLPQQLPLQLQPQQTGTDAHGNHTNGSTHAEGDSAATLTPPLPIMIVSNKCETVFVSSDGDVLTSRCRYTPYPTSSASLMGDGSNSRHHHHHHHHADGSNTNGSNTAIGAFPVLAAVVCCDHSTYHSNHTGYNHNNGDSQGFRNSPNQHDRNASPIIHPYTGSRNNNDDDVNDVNIDTTTVHNHASVSSDVHRGDVDLTDTASGNGTPLFMKSFDQSEFSEMGALDETSCLSPISRHTDDVPDASTTAISTARTDTHQNHPSRSSSTTRAAPRRLQQPPQLFHGIPTFVSYFSSIKIRHISAHATGAHVLLISHPGILYAYGLNTYGQLGIGFKSHSRDVHQGYVMRPTIVTSLLENGGKTIACAAGASHSLVVVEVEQQRMIKSRSLEMVTQKQPRGTSNSFLRTRQQSDAPNTIATSTGLHESKIVKYHQMYGFGRNDYMKIGLVRPTREMSLPKRNDATNVTTTMPGTVSLVTNQNTMTDQGDCVLFPRRVALRCSVIHKKLDGASRISKVKEFPPKGIFAIAASSEHSAALLHQPNGDIELYTWGNATYGTLGLPPSSFVTHPLSTTITTTTAVFRIAPYPSLVACLSKTSNPEVQAQHLLRNERNEFPVTMSLSRCCSFVVTNLGRIFSFGTSEDGMLGLGRSVTEAQTPMEVTLPEDARHEKIISVSAGTLHVSVCTSAGHVYSWGARSHAGFDIQTSSNSSQQQNRKPPTIMKGPTPIEDLIQFEWSPRHVEFSNSTKHGRFKHYNHSDGIPKLSPKIVQARAGNDCTFFVTDSGKVLSSGKSSGRFGQGEYDADVTIPKPLFGGLHLFQQKENNHLSSGMSNDSNNDNDNTQPRSTTTSLRSKARRLASA